MEQIDLKLIQSDQEVKKEVLEVYEYLKVYKDALERSNWEKRVKENWNIVENIIWTEEEKEEMLKEGQIPFETNRCIKGIQGSAAIITDQQPELKFLPIGNGDLYVAELLKRGFDVVWTKNDGNDTVYDLVEKVDVGGIDFISVNLDKSKTPFGTILFEEDPPDDIYFDKDSRKRDFSDTHIIKAKMRNLEYIKEHYPNLSERDIYFMPISKEDKQTSSGVEGVDNYAVDADNPDQIPADVKSKQKVIWEIEAWLIKYFKEDWVASIGDDGQPVTGKLNLKDGEKVDEIALEKEGKFYWPRKVQKRVQRIIVGKKLISERINPNGEDADGDPVINIIGLKGQRTRSAYSMSKTDYARPLNKEKNKRRIQAIHAAAHSINSPLWFTEDVKWHGKPGTPGSYAIIGKNAGPNPLGRLPSGAMDVPILIRLEEISDEEIDDIYKFPSVMQGKLPKGGDSKSGRLILALQDGAQLANRPATRRLESALVRLAKIIVALMLKHWPRYMWERLLEEEEKLNFAPDGTEENKRLQENEEDEDIRQKIALKWEDALEMIRPKDISQPPGLNLIDIDIKIVAGSSMPTNRTAKGMLAIEYVNAGIFDAEAALEYVDDPNRDKIIERLKKKEEAERQLAMTKGLG